MLLSVDENENCEFAERVFPEVGSHRTVSRLNLESPAGQSGWFDVTGVSDDGTFIPARAVKIEDSGAALAWLVYGGAWGLRLKPVGDETPWSLSAANQSGVPFKVLDESGVDIKFAD